jgi:hypothetical protein
MIIDGNRDGRQVLFPHRLHEDELGGRESCDTCHHQNMPLQKSSPCSDCHRDMYVTTDIFDHASHQQKLGGNDGCAKCHDPEEMAKMRDTAKECAGCHEAMVATASRIKPDKRLTGFAPGYMTAMHGLCIDCHKETAKKRPQELGERFFECANCHRNGASDMLLTMPPYVAEEARQ